MLGYIHDGYTLEGYIKESPRLYPALHFTYRPILLQNRTVIFSEISRLNRQEKPAEAELLAARAMKAQLISWDLLDKDGKPVPVTTDDILRMQPELNGQLFNILMGKQPSDLDPDGTNSQTRDHLEKALAGQMEPTELIEEAGGNSQAG